MTPKSFKRERPQHDKTSVNMRAVVLTALGIVVTLVGAALLARWLTNASGTARSGPTEAQLPRAVLLSSDPVKEMEAYRGEKRALLESYGWVDREQGIAHIPIERAIAIASDTNLARTTDRRSGDNRTTTRTR